MEGEAMNHLYLDIETIPAQSERAKAIIAATVKPPAQMKKADTIATWEAEAKPAAVLEAIAKTSFDGGFGHVCCIGFALNDGPIDSQTATIVDEEKQAIQSVFETVGVMVHDSYAPIQIVGHYVAGFDLRFLTQRAIVLGIRLPMWWPKDPKPWSAEVFDTMTVWAGVKGTISLDNLCIALGLEGKGDIDGSMVAQMFAEGRHTEIAEYCKDDVARVRRVHRKMQIAMGEAA
jgi:DNA polymerase elongation subunit (family B)